MKEEKKAHMNETRKVYAGYNVRQDIRMSSSSGAVFSSLAEYVLERKGVVYGVKMSEDCYFAEFARVTDAEELAMLRGSKYLQAKVGNTFRQVRTDLTAGRLVLFSGTGCQVNGLKGFLGKKYENLLCVDVICHGTPSPTLWKKYAQHQEQKAGGKLTEINFRCKDDNWADFGMKEFHRGVLQEEQKKVYSSKDTDPYMVMFLRDYCLRPSCYECPARDVKMADLTIADFWGIDDVAPEMNDGRGTSLVLVRTNKGERLLEAVRSDLKLKEVTYEEGVRCNPSEYRSCRRPPQRDSFFNDMNEMSFEELEKKYAAPPKASVKDELQRKMKNAMRQIERMIRGVKKSNETYGILFVFDPREKIG